MLLKKLIIVLCLSAPAFGQAWSGILSTSRAERWDQNAGLPPTFLDGETTSAAWVPPTRSTVCQTLGAGASGATIAAAIVSCSSTSAGSVVVLPAGTSTLSADLNLYGKNVTLRGAGPMSTTINLNGHNLFMGRHSGAGSAAVTAGLSQGSTSLTVASSSGFTVGMIVQMYQCDSLNSGNPCSLTTPTDNGGVWSCGFNSVCNLDGGAGVYRSQQQTLLITNVAGNVLTVSPGVRMPNWSTSRTATIERNDFASFPNTGLGLENMTIITPATGGTINMHYGYASWMSGIRFIGSNTNGGNPIIAYEGCMRCLLANSYGYGLDPSALNYTSYIFLESERGSDNLFINNIWQDITFRGGGYHSGDVIAYNYHRDVMANNASGFEEDSIFQHNPEVNYDLAEGNQLGQIRDDDTWGTHHFDTWFRNFMACYDVPFFNTTSTSLGLQIGSFARFENAIGNAIGSKDSGGSLTGCLTYQNPSFTPTTAAFMIQDGVSDPLTFSSTMRWGNVTTITQSSDTPTNSGVRFVSSEVPSALVSPNAALSNPVPGNTTLPASFFMSATAHSNGGTGLSWWKTCTNWTSFPTTCGTLTTPPFPTIGPDVTGGPYVNGFAYNNPAYLAWLNLPTDATLQSSFTVTGSSWSGGTETLTVTIAAGWHIQGGFTPPAWNSACNPSSGLSYTGRTDKEILMTASSATTISYALTGNPGVSCTGTVKWPDVRQFDSRVYASDIGPAPPTGISGVVH